MQLSESQKKRMFQLGTPMSNSEDFVEHPEGGYGVIGIEGDKEKMYEADFSACEVTCQQTLAIFAAADSDEPVTIKYKNRKTGVEEFIVLWANIQRRIDDDEITFITHTGVLEELEFGRIHYYFGIPC